MNVNFELNYFIKNILKTSHVSFNNNKNTKTCILNEAVSVLNNTAILTKSSRYYGLGF